MNAGDLRDQVFIQKRETAADSKLGRTTTWVDFVTESALESRRTVVWAHLRPLTTAESLRAGAIGAKVQHEVTIRFRGDVTEKMRILWTPYQSSTAKTLEIHGVQPADGKRQFLLLTCSELV